MRCWIALISFVWLLVVTPCLAEEPDLAHAIRELKAWRSKFATIRVEYNWQTRTELLARFPELAENQKWDDYLHHDAWLWTDTGMLRSDRNTREAAQIVRRTFNGTDGVNSWGAISQRGDSGKSWEAINIWPRGPTSSQAGGWIVEPIYHLWAHQEAVWLGDYLEQHVQEADGVTDYKGHRCLKVKFKIDTLYLDLEHNCLPRLVEPPPPGRFLNFENEVEEFHLLPEGIWFPKRGRARQVAQDYFKTWEVTKVTLNAHTSKEHFQPPEPTPGTLLHDMTPGRPYAAKFYANPQNVRAKKTENKVAPGRPSSPVSATPLDHRWIWWTTSVGALLLGVLAVWLNGRRK